MRNNFRRCVAELKSKIEAIKSRQKATEDENQKQKKEIDDITAQITNKQKERKEMREVIRGLNEAMTKEMKSIDKAKLNSITRMASKD